MADLYDWSDLEKRERWGTLLLGNGMSINVSSRFDYSSLYDEAKGRNLLASSDEAMFELFSTKNFEVALSKLRDAIVIAEAFEENTDSYKACFRSIQDTLGHAVQKVHLKGREVPTQNLAAIQNAFLPHRKIFTTSYDLLVYWAIGHGRGYRLFCDCFWGNHNEFDPANCAVRRDFRPIYYLHGALHLVVGGDGITWKLTRKDLKAGEKEILDRFYKPVPGDPEARPLLVTEGSSRDKLQMIEANDYFAHTYRVLAEDDQPLLVFGHSLGDQDQHLIDAIKANPERPVAISMVAKNRWDIDEQQARIRKRLKMKDVSFYDAASHPLGSSDLRVRRFKLRHRRRLSGLRSP